MLEKIKSKTSITSLKQLRDIRLLSLIIFGSLVLLVSWSGIGVIQTNYELQKNIAKLEQQNTVQELENNNLKLRNQYYNTDRFLELAARRQFGRAAPGEKLIVVPKEVAFKYAGELPKEENTEAIATTNTKPWYQRNFESWMSFFLHRPNIQS